MSLSELVLPPWVTVFGKVLKVIWPVLLVGAVTLSGWYMLHRIDSLKTQNADMAQEVKQAKDTLDQVVHEQERLTGLVKKNSATKAVTAKKAQSIEQKIIDAPKNSWLDEPSPIDLCDQLPDLCSKTRPDTPSG